jgi:hypothetical protein
MVYGELYGYPETTVAAGPLLAPGKYRIDYEPTTALDDITQDLTVRYFLNDVEVGSTRYTAVKQITVVDNNRGTVVIRTDSFAVRVEATITKCLWDNRRLLAEVARDAVADPPGYDLDFDRAHLLAKRFGGRGDLRNIVSMKRRVNQAGGAYRQMEKQFEDRLNALVNPTDKASIQILPIYDPATEALFGTRVRDRDMPSWDKLRPLSFTVTFDSGAPIRIQNR